jgi:long-subunit fatty acid transport protein
VTKILNGLFTIAVGLGFASHASAAGYEKSIMWGGKTGAVAGISTSYIEGADALYFNPAGLVKAGRGQDLSFNISPVWSKFSGPYNNTNDSVDSTSNFATPLSMIYSNTLNDQWAFGVGGFISGGSKVTYDNIDFAGFTGVPSTKTDLQIGELSVGAAWKPTAAWKFGAAYRYVLARANFSFFKRAYNGANNVGLVNANLNDLKDQESAFRLGAQWALSEKTHIGLTYRSEVALQASGNVDGTFYGRTAFAVPQSQIQSGTATATTVFPQAVTLGIDQALSETWQALAEIAWTNYARVDNIGVQTAGATFNVGATATSVGNTQLTQNWKDQYNFRLGGNYLGFSYPIRFGYGLTTQVTDSDWARPTFTPPGTSHTFTIGSGHTCDLMGQKIDFNGAAEYTIVSGDGNGRVSGDNVAASDGSSDIRAGSYKTNSVALHLGVAYNF